jgi:hypothetical protein
MFRFAAALLALAVAAPVAQAGEYLGTINIVYARGAGIKSVADEADKRERRDNRLGTGFIIVGGRGPVPPEPPGSDKRDTDSDDEFGD